MTQAMTEGLDILTNNRIPYILERSGDGRATKLIKMPKNSTYLLRRYGFRVGKAIFSGENIVFYKGRFFGIISD